MKVKAEIVLGILVQGLVVSCTAQPEHYYGVKKMCRVRPDNLRVVPFYVDETPVTYEDFSQYVKAGGRKTAYWLYDSYHIPQQPVTGISWHQAVDYCNWRSKCEGLSPVYKKTDGKDAWGYPVYGKEKGANGYRLPTKEEFETAAGRLNGSLYPWGNDFNDSLANYDNDRGHKTTTWWRLAPVKSQYRNRFGLFNICGNNWHWCDDWTDTLNHTKYLAGGSWGTVSRELLKNHPVSSSSPGNYNYDIGFRCLLPASSVRDSIAGIKWVSDHDFFSPPVSELKQQVSDFYSGDFAQRLQSYLSDNYPECINFLMQVDGQEILTPGQMTEIIMTVCKRNSVNPLFLTSIMISESGFGTVSFPRWFNNPMAYFWQNKLMANGRPVYLAVPGKTNRKFRTLEEGFDAFCKGIRRDLYFKAAEKTLDAFHLIYVGYRADEWMHTLTRVYRDVAGVRFEPVFPQREAGQYIYTDWKAIAATLKQ